MIMKKIILGLMACLLCINSYAQRYEDSPNYNKKIAVFGGSFSVIPASDVAKAYWVDMLRSQVTTYGIGGAGFSIKTGEDRWLPGQIDKALASGTDYDIFVIWASTNDVTRETPLEEQEAQIKLCVDKLRKGAPKAKILFFSSMPVPLHEHATEEEINNTPEMFRHVPKNMKKLPLYVENQEKVCKELGIPFLNLYTTSGINDYNALDFFSFDKLHLNSAGYNHLKETLARFIAAN